MSKVLVNETSLSGIANSIRAKNGTETTYKPSEMAAAIDAIQTGGTVEALDITANGTYTAPEGVDGYSPITVNVPQDGSPPESAFVISGDCSYRFANGGWDWFIENYGNKITTNGIYSADHMFYNSRVTSIPFDINFYISANSQNSANMFHGCGNITEVPKVKHLCVYNTQYFFSQCTKLRTIPDDFADTWDWSYLEKQTGAYTGMQSYMFWLCYSLRSIPICIINHGNPYLTYSYSYFYTGFSGCYVLDELVNLPIPYTNTTWESNAFSNTFPSCYRLKNITFALQDDGTPYIAKWRNQVIDLTLSVGYADNRNRNNILNYNSGITADKEVTDDASYQALKDDPDWFTCNIAYSRYNHDSAVATINSLPDTSAYLATAGGTNTIKFKGAAGSATDGGAINTLTEEEIAVATSRGWTVTLA